MAEKQFVESIIEVASELKGSNITSSEQNQIIEKFNQKVGSAYERAKSSIEEVIGKKLSRKLLLEKAASLNNLQNLLTQMSSAADKWQQTKK